MTTTTVAAGDGACLAAAYKKMTKAKVVDQAVALADLTQRFASLNTSLIESAATLHEAIAERNAVIAKLQSCIRQVDDLFGAHKKAAARAMLRELALVDIDCGELPKIGSN